MDGMECAWEYPRRSLRIFVYYVYKMNEHGQVQAQDVSLQGI